MSNHRPYRIHEAGVDSKWLLVNRQYKPVGNNKREVWAVYAAMKIHFVLDDAIAIDVSRPDHVRSSGFYGDGSQPWSSRADAEGYLERMRRLLAALDKPFAMKA